MELTRRQLLGLGLAGGAAALLVGLVPLASGRTPDEAALLELLAEALFPGGAGVPRPDEVAAGEHARRFLDRLPRAARLEVRGLLRLLEHGTALRTGRRWSQLEPGERRAVLAGLAAARSRAPRRALAALKRVCAYGLYTRPRTWAALGYDGPTLLRLPP